MEKFILVAEDCPVTKGTVPPDGPKKTLARIEYEVLVENPYKYNQLEFYTEVNKRRNRQVKLKAWMIRRAELPKKWGWGIHINKEGKMYLIPMESEKYRELERTIKTVRAFRNKKNKSKGNENEPGY